MPPPTAASNRRAAPVRRAMASSAGPWWAMTCLFAVTTGLPIDSAAAMSVCAGSSPPMQLDDDVGAVVGHEVGRGVASRGRRAAARGDRPVDVADGDADQLEAPDRPPAEASAGRSSSAQATSSPTVPAPRTRDTQRCARSCVGSAGSRHRRNGSRRPRSARDRAAEGGPLHSATMTIETRPGTRPSPRRAPSGRGSSAASSRRARRTSGTTSARSATTSGSRASTRRSTASSTTTP